MYDFEHCLLLLWILNLILLQQNYISQKSTDQVVLLKICGLRYHELSICLFSLLYCLSIIVLDILFINNIGKHIQAKELEANSEYYIDLVAKGTGKSKEEIAKEVQRPKFFQAQEAIDYGLADKILKSGDPTYEKRVMNISLLLLMFILCKHIMQNDIPMIAFLIRIVMICVLNQEVWGELVVAVLKWLLQD